MMNDIAIKELDTAVLMEATAKLVSMKWTGRVGARDTSRLNEQILSLLSAAGILSRVLRDLTEEIESDEMRPESPEEDDLMFGLPDLRYTWGTTPDLAEEERRRMIDQIPDINF